ncbi:hypothetical protein OBBRIDRAFT_764080 [Obba rivulosa]|uniref:F-box domain-containing protein n=1 Tax=Obba rivulosa TaxID=1052685 RepID=A0A8E2DJB4_9APHY|nr:hypothetical protein OBBRIDRAFT_764080 [Obba rivulosa]
MCRAISILPPELIDYTIDVLHSDYQVLKACALVCRAWLPSAQLHLFYEMCREFESSHNFRIESIIYQRPHLAGLVRECRLSRRAATLKSRASDFHYFALVLGARLSHNNPTVT